MQKSFSRVHRVVNIHLHSTSAPKPCIYQPFSNQLPPLHHSPTITTKRMASTTPKLPVNTAPIKLAILHQALPPPTLNGVTKPAKPGGYKDSGSDIANCLSSCEDPQIQVLTPTPNPDPSSQDDWTFPETPEGIHEALDAGATHLWANIHSFAEHPLQTLKSLEKFEGTVKVVGQPPRLADYADDKAWFNEYLRNRSNELGVEMPRAVLISTVDGKGSVGEQVGKAVEKVGTPAIAKPPRGRGSTGVKKCDTKEELQEHVEKLLEEGQRVIVEEFLNGEEGTVAVMPPALNDADKTYRALPFVQRFDQTDGVMAYSGKTPVSVNSRAKTLREIEEDKTYGDAMRQCEAVAGTLQATALTRIDVRRRGTDGRFVVFDVNLKPNYTGPGRPGREEQLNLMAMGAEKLGWSYEQFLREALDRARPLGELRQMGGHFDRVFKEWYS